MTLTQMQELWELARAIHEGRQKLAWGRIHDPWPAWSTAYPHNPVPFVDLALASAEAVVARFRVIGIENL